MTITMAKKEPIKTEVNETPTLKEADLQPQQLPQQPQMKKYKKEELLGVFDELIFQGEYTEEQTIKGKLKVTFRSRSADETMQISRNLDAMDFKLLTTMQEQRAFL